MSVRTAVSLAAVTVALAACGGPDDPKPGHGQTSARTPAPTPPTAIRLTTQGADGQRVSTRVQCGPNESLKKCAKIAEHAMKQAADLNSGGKSSTD